MSPRLAEMLSKTTISRVWVALGGPEPRHGRARAFYRRGNNGEAVSIDDEKGTWFDHRDGRGGGVLDLIQLVRHCDRAEAFYWLAAFTGTQLDDHQPSPAERRAFALAAQEGIELAAWKDRLLAALREERKRWWGIYHQTLRYLVDHGSSDQVGDIMTMLAAPHGEQMATLHESACQKIGRLDDDIDRLARTPYSDLLPIFRDQNRKRRTA